MNNSSKHTPVYEQMIDLLRNAFEILDEQGKAEVFSFIISQQNADGGFQDRGGSSDLYYSLFGGLMLRAGSPLNPPMGDFKEGVAKSSALLKGLKEFLGNQKEDSIPGFIERCCLILLQKDLKFGWKRRFRSFRLLSMSFWKERHSINLSYRGFVLFLTLDAVLPFPGLLKFGVNKLLKGTTVDAYSPCSEVAAKVFLLKMMNREGLTEQELLKSFACKSGGFKSFLHVSNADMLSTAVALFALDFAGSDLRLLKPACLEFIQENFVEGAFLSGDGDLTKDLEYTFYGMLALGVLAD